MKRLFDTIYSATEELVKAAKKPLVEKKVKRALEAVLDEIEDNRIELQEAQEKALDALINESDSDKTGLIKEFAEWDVELKDLAELSTAVVALQKKLFDIKEVTETNE